MKLVDLATIAGGIAAVAAVGLSILDRQERRERAGRPDAAPPVPQPPPPAPKVMLDAAPTAWGGPAPAVNTGRTVASFQGILAYLFGLLGAVPCLLVRRQDVRYHALQSIGIDVLAILYTIVFTVVGVTWQLAHNGGNPLPSNDPVLNVGVAGFFLVELLPRFYCVLQILRVRPARVPLVWRYAATIAARVKQLPDDRAPPDGLQPPS